MKAQMTKVPGYKNVVILKQGRKFFSAISDGTGTEIIPGCGGAKSRPLMTASKLRLLSGQLDLQKKRSKNLSRR